jgi:glutamyl-tRNA synthetase
MQLVTRFAPSPTGYLHIGGARTALFNWLYARKNGGKFLLRIEDTDKERSTEAAIECILKSMELLGLNWDGDVVYQSKRTERHQEVAYEMLNKGLAYKCYASTEEINAFREQNPHKKFISPWRNQQATSMPSDAKFTIRLKARQEGTTTVSDTVRGDVTINNSELDDMILLRSDGSPTYMLAVVVDDKDMGVNHIIRGDDHFTNTFRQLQIIEAMGWEVPRYSHVPLIHGMDGAKLSKRHGALSVDSYFDMGYLAEALKNYLLRLGWSYGDEEIIPTERALEIFDIKNLGKSAARFDIEKLNFINSYYINNTADTELFKLIKHLLPSLNGELEERIIKGISLIKPRAHTLVELALLAKIYIEKGELDDKAANVLKTLDSNLFNDLTKNLSLLNSWQLTDIQACCNAIANERGIKIGNIMQILRSTVVGNFNSPSIYEVMQVLGKDESLARMRSISA